MLHLLVYFVSLIKRILRLKHEMQSMAIYYGLHVYFQIDLKLFWDLIIYSFVENFRRYLLIIKKRLNYTDNRRETFKILMSPFFLGHPLNGTDCKETNCDGTKWNWNELLGYRCSSSLCCR